MPPPTPEVLDHAVAMRVPDTRFVLDTLTVINADANPGRGAPRAAVGAGWRIAADRRGHVTPSAARPWPRRCSRTSGSRPGSGGTLFGSVINAGLDRPFMFVAAQGNGRDNDETWAKFWANQRGWRLNLQLTGSAHGSFTDSQILLPQTAGALNFPPDVVRQAIGTIDPHRSIVNQRAYITAFFDTHVRHRDSHLLDHPSPRFPEMQFLP